MAVKVFVESQYREAVKQAIREGRSQQDIMAEIPVPKRSYFRYLNEVKAEQKSGKVDSDNKAPVAAPPPTTTKVLTGAAPPTQFAVVTTKTPAPIVFIMGDQRIDLNPVYLYDAYRYCEDIKRMEPAIDDDFTLMIKVATKRLWEHFSQREAQRMGVNLSLVEKGDANG